MTATSYDAIAEWYAANVQEGGAGAWAFPSLLALLGEIRGQQICDLGCGEGRIARLLAQCNAQVVGVDRSAALINTAQRLEAAHPLGIHYQEDDAQSLTTIPDATFDGVVCGLALMDIPDLEATLRAVWRVLKPSGWFAFLITHPCFAAPHAHWLSQADGAGVWVIEQYFNEGFYRTAEGGHLAKTVGAHHRMLSTYLNRLITAGFTITKLVEPQRENPPLEGNFGHMIVPLLLLVKCMKLSAPP